MDRRLTALFISILVCATAFALMPSQSLAQDPAATPAAGELQWQPLQLVSSLLRGSWFPQMAIDPRGDVNVVWSVTGEGQGFRELLYFSRWDGTAWSRPIDIKDGANFIVRSALAADKQGILHLVFDDLATAAYSNATLDEAGSAQGWSKPFVFGNPKEGYLFDIATDSKDTLHVIYGDSVPQCPTCVQLYYRRSFDGGYAWTAPVQLTDQIVSRQHMQVMVDANDIIYAVWDNVSANGKSRSGGFTMSADGGENWSAPVEFFSSAGTPSQLAIGTDNKGTLIIVYRISESDELDYLTSTDGGRTWSRPEQIQDIFAAKDVTGFDKYSMATDSAGTVYLALTGRTSAQQQDTGLYLLRWTGSGWTKPQTVLENDAVFPEYPSLEISQGNHLHLVFHVRGAKDIFDLPNQTYKVYYTNALTSAPEIALQPLPTATLTPTATPTEIPVTSTPTPTRTPFVSTVPEAPSGSGLPQLPILLALAPVVILILGILVWRLTARRT